MSAIDACLENAEKYASGFTAGELSPIPDTRVAIVACMDARLEPAALFGLREGDAHVIRNAGGVVTEDVIRSLTISQRVLGTREIMVIHHTDCGMTKFSATELRDAIESQSGVRPRFAMKTFADLEGQVRRSVARLRESPFLPQRRAIRGFVYEVATGRLREVA